VICSRRARAVLVDLAGVEIRVDGHLLAGERVQGKTRGNFRGADRAVIDDQVLNGNQGEEKHESDHVVAAHHELPERFDHLARGRRALVAVEQNPPCARQV